MSMEGNIQAIIFDIVKIAGVIVAAVATIIQVSLKMPKQRKSLKDDLEVLKALGEGHDKYDQVKECVDEKIEHIYGDKQRQRISSEKPKWKLFVFGIIWTGIFASLSIIIIVFYVEYKWWSLLTGYLTLAGVGWIVMSLRWKHLVKEWDEREVHKRIMNVSKHINVFKRKKKDSDIL